MSRRPPWGGLHHRMGTDSRLMALLNLLLDLVALVLLLTGLGIGARTPVRRAGTLLGSLTLAEGSRARRWPLFGSLVALLALRPLLYAPLAEVTGWVPAWNPTPATVPFRADFARRLLAFSVLSFGWTLFQFLTWIFFAAVLARGTREPSAWSRFFNDMLGPLSRLPSVLMILVPTVVAGLIWMAASVPLHWMDLLPAVHSWKQLASQAALIGAGVWISVGWMLCGLLLLRLINTYVYLGTHPFWDFVHQVGGVALRPLEWMPARIGKLDLTALIGAAILGAAAQGAERGLAHLYLHLRP